MPEFDFLRAWATTALARARDGRNERGDVAQTVIITAILAALAIAVGAIIVAKFTDKANSIPTG